MCGNGTPLDTVRGGRGHASRPILMAVHPISLFHRVAACVSPCVTPCVTLNLRLFADPPGCSRKLKVMSGR